MRERPATEIIRGLLWVNLAAGFILYVSLYRHLSGVLTLIRNLTPPLLLIGGFALVWSRDRSIIRRRRYQGEETEVIVVTNRDALLHDTIAFLTALLIIVMPIVLSGDGVDFIDLLQAGLALLAISFLRHYYFSKTQ